MKVYGIQAGPTVQRGEQMTRKKDRQAAAQQGAGKLSTGSQSKKKTDNATSTASAKGSTIVKKGGQPVNQYADSYQPSRASTVAPLRSDKIEHARAMIKNNGYNNPQVLEAIIDRLVFALKE
ncbi:MAG: hypothetical protein WBP29_01895 [Candidatus Zixiibacteriota bacterium]